MNNKELDAYFDKKCEEIVRNHPQWFIEEQLRLQEEKYKGAR